MKEEVVLSMIRGSHPELFAFVGVANRVGFTFVDEMSEAQTRLKLKSQGHKQSEIDSRMKVARENPF